jgi:succinate dehydrogenase/fumarate reductase cytochrome b subunit
METADICKSCNAPLTQIGLNVCPNCKAVQHRVYQPEEEVKSKSSTDKLRVVYGFLVVAIFLFVGIALWKTGGGTGAQGMQQACATVKATGYSGSIKDCMAKMANPGQ